MAFLFSAGTKTSFSKYVNACHCWCPVLVQDLISLAEHAAVKSAGFNMSLNMQMCPDSAQDLSFFG